VTFDSTNLFTAEEQTLLSAAAPSIAAGLRASGYETNKTVAAVVLVVEAQFMTVDFVEAGEEPEHFIRAIKAMAPSEEHFYREKLSLAFALPAGGTLRLLVATPHGTATMKMVLSREMPS